MKLAIMKLGANITFSSSNKSAANADILYFLRQLDISKHDIMLVTHHTRNTIIPKRIRSIELWKEPLIRAFHGFDAIVVFNGSLNFFGGAKDPGILALYKVCAKSDLPIIWVYTDGQLIFKQLWPSIKKRDWAQDLKESDYHIPPDRVRYLSQFRDLVKVNNKLDEKPDYIYPSQVIHYPLAITILAKHEQYIKFKTIPFEERDYDLVYGGATRNTHKRKRIEHYYNDPKYDTMVFGNLRGVSVPHARIVPKCSYQDFIRYQSLGRATILIGDQFYNNNNFSLRFYEAILADVIPFIDNQLDPEHLFYYNKNFDTSWLYITKTEHIHLERMNDYYKDFQFVKRILLDQYNYEGYQQLLEASLEGCMA